MSSPPRSGLVAQPVGLRPPLRGLWGAPHPSSAPTATPGSSSRWFSSSLPGGHLAPNTCHKQLSQGSPEPRPHAAPIVSVEPAAQGKPHSTLRKPQRGPLGSHRRHEMHCPPIPVGQAQQSPGEVSIVMAIVANPFNRWFLLQICDRDQARRWELRRPLWTVTPPPLPHLVQLLTRYRRNSLPQI